MKKLFYLSLILLVIACGKEEQKKEKSGFKKPAKKETVKKTSTQKVDGTVDLSNKGIGPITSVDFGKVDNSLAEKGATFFKQKCTACHKTDKRLIGPALKGIYDKRSPEWVMNMMLNPTEMLKKDPIAKEQLKQYNGVMMIDQNLSEEEARAIAEYLRTI